ncbi:MAG: GGDEF domain-containing protein [Aliarcobacter sp.]|jgi:diguanylate cyclase (GGDEF)-like protein|nr:GGDEF domain-containing protein [Aliarcobacter sp.]
MTETYDFLKLILNTLKTEISVIDKKGDIKFTNLSWRNFAEDNDCKIDFNKDKEINYLEICNNSVLKGDSFGKKALIGIQKVINKELDVFYLEYPCHSKNIKRWFMMRVTPFVFDELFYYVIAHENITERKLAEEEALRLAIIDKLTKIPNRREFDNFLEKEWLRCKRLNMPISLAIVDIDYFKLLNDTYGHQQGDICLQRVAKQLVKFSKRASDICARYGGEEFVFVFGNTTKEKSLIILNNVMKSIDDLKIPNINSLIKPTLTVSIGLSTMYPKKDTEIKEFINEADRMLYKSKENGRNRVSFIIE